MALSRPLALAAVLTAAALAPPAAAAERLAAGRPHPEPPATATSAAGVDEARPANAVAPEPASPSLVEHVIWFAAGALAGGAAVSALAGGSGSRRPSAPRRPDVDLRRLLGEGRR